MPLLTIFAVDVRYAYRHTRVTVTRYSFFLPDELKRGLEALKARDGINESEAIRRAVAEFLKRHRVTVRAQRGGVAKRSR